MSDSAPCAVDGCYADGRGTANGSPPMLCGGFGHRDPRCMANWATWDREDMPTYGEYLAWLDQRRAERPG